MINRRFVAYYFNVGKGQPGYNEKASEFVHQFDKRFQGRAIPTPPVWVVTPEAELLGTLDNYSPRAEFFTGLRELLKENPKYDHLTTKERETLEAAGQRPLDAAALLFELGRYERVRKLARTAVSDEAKLLLARIARYEMRWDDAVRHLDAIENRDLTPQVALERGHQYIHDEDYERARKLMVEAIHEFPNSRVLGSLHFYAGVACFMQGERQWANFHWGWIMNRIPDDHNYMRAYGAATADAMPYPNPELDGYRGDTRMITHRSADAERARAQEDFEALRDQFRDPD